MQVCLMQIGVKSYFARCRELLMCFTREDISCSIYKLKKGRLAE